MHYAFFLERLYFSFQFCLVLFAPISGWTPTNFFWRICTHFSFVKNTPFFSLIVHETYCKPPPSPSRDREDPGTLPGTLPEAFYTTMIASRVMCE
jgi:hypothetical protein